MPTILQIQNLDILELKKLIKEVLSEELLPLKDLINKDSSPPIDTSSEHLMSMKDAARFLQVTTVSLYKYIKEGNVKTYRVGKRRRFRKSDLEKYLSNNKNNR